MHRWRGEKRESRHHEWNSLVAAGGLWSSFAPVDNLVPSVSLLIGYLPLVMAQRCWEMATGNDFLNVQSFCPKKKKKEAIQYFFSSFLLSIITSAEEGDVFQFASCWSR